MNPLRKIVETVIEYEKDQHGWEYPRRFEILECGHKVTIRKDIYGETNAYRRLCKKCGSVVKNA